MGITVEQALSIGGLQQGKLLAGAGGLQNIIDHVCVLEQPPYQRWLRPNEFMLTTFFCLKDDIKGQVSSIEALAAARAAALAVHLGNFGYTIPPVLIECANSYGLPLIELPSHLSYVEIITPLMAAVLDRQNHLLRRSEDIHNQLIDVVLTGGELQSVVDIMGGLLRRPVVLSGPRGEIIKYSRQPDSGQFWLEEGPEGLNIRSQWAQALRSYNYRTDKSESTGPEVLVHEGRYVRYLPVRLNGTVAALLSAVDDGQVEFDQLDVITLRQGVLAASLVMLKEGAVRAAEQRTKNDLFHELISGNLSHRQDVVNRAYNFGWDLEHKHQVVILQSKVTDPARLAEQSCSNDVLAQAFHTDILFSTAVAMAHEYSPNSIVLQDDEQVIILPHLQGPFHRENALRNALELVQCIIEDMQRILSNVSTVGSMGRVYESFHDLPMSYDEASRVVSLRPILGIQEQVIHYEEVAAFDILQHVLSNDKSTTRLLSIITPLLEYDPPKGFELVRTLELYLDVGKNLEQTARKLDIHPNTVKYRLKRVHDILGFDPSLPSYYMSLHLATKLVRLPQFGA